jgi:hypothetical protein
VDLSTYRSSYYDIHGLDLSKLYREAKTAEKKEEYWDLLQKKNNPKGTYKHILPFSDLKHMIIEGRSIKLLFESDNSFNQLCDDIDNNKSLSPQEKSDRIEVVWLTFPHVFFMEGHKFNKLELAKPYKKHAAAVVDFLNQQIQKQRRDQEDN